MSSAVQGSTIQVEPGHEEHQDLEDAAWVDRGEAGQGQGAINGELISQYTHVCTDVGSESGLKNVLAR